MLQSNVETRENQRKLYFHLLGGISSPLIFVRFLFFNLLSFHKAPNPLEKQFTNRRSNSVGFSKRTLVEQYCIIRLVVDIAIIKVLREQLNYTAHWRDDLNNLLKHFR